MEKQISILANVGKKLSVNDMKQCKGGWWGNYGPYPLFWYCDTRIVDNICYVNDEEGCSNECGAPCRSTMNGCPMI
jgi:hypothetical protein